MYIHWKQLDFQKNSFVKVPQTYSINLLTVLFSELISWTQPYMSGALDLK
jgi:hypothetical protein